MLNSCRNQKNLWRGWIKNHNLKFTTTLKAQIKNDRELFKKLTTTIWEFRTLYNKTYYRLFAFWNKQNGQNTLVLATHGLIKKTGKIPLTELEKAEKIRQQYLNENK